MKTLLISNLIGLLIFLISSVAAQPLSCRWIEASKGDAFDRGTCISIDRLGNIITGGYYDIANLEISGNTLNHVQFNDMYLAKYDTSGHLKWVTYVTGNGHQMPEDLCFDQYDNIFVTGGFSGDQLSFDQVNYMDTGVYLVKYDSSGKLIWTLNENSVVGTSVVCDGLGNIYVAGCFSGTVKFDSISVVSQGGKDGFIAKFNPQGAVYWVKTLNGDEKDIVQDLALAGNDLVAGAYFESDSVSFEGHSLTNTGGVDFLNSLFSDLLLIKLDENGQVQWIQKEGAATGREVPVEIVTDTLNNIYLTGNFSSDSFNIGSFILKNKSLPNSFGYKFNDIFMAKYNKDGQIQWVSYFGGENNDVVNGMAYVNNNKLALSAAFNSEEINIENIELVNPNGGGLVLYYDLFIGMFDVSGHFLRLVKAEGNGAEECNAIVASKTGNDLYGAGYFSGDSLNIGLKGVANSTDISSSFFMNISLSELSNIDDLKNNVHLNPIRIFPNPSNKILFVINDGGIHACQISIIDLNGRILYSSEYLSNQVEIDLDFLSAGVYFLKYESRSNDLLTFKKFIKY